LDKLVSNDFHIQKASLADAEIIRHFAEFTFRDTYAAGNTPENMEAYCLHAFSVDVIQAELSDANIQYHLAMQDQGLVGFIKTIPSFPPGVPSFKKPLQLSRIYVHPNQKSKGIGAMLLATAVSIALEQQNDLLWLGVWQENERAIAFYKKMGFEIMGTDTFVLGNDPQIDWVMGMPVLK
jgi:ribosomal protein S18 acetylase RimI-like enzyme